MDEIKNWLESGEDYAEGLVLMMRHSKNRAMIHHLSRKEDMARLRYQLEKLVGVTQPVVAVVVQQSDALPPAVKEFGRATLDALPDTMRPYAQEAMESYHKARKAHTHLKEAATDDQRREIRKELIKHIADNQKNWALVDAFLKEGTLPQELVVGGAAKEFKAIPQHVMNAKSNLSKALAALEKNPPADKAAPLKEKINGLLAELSKEGHEPSEKVQVRLRALELL